MRALSIDPNYAPALANLKYLESLEQKPRPMPAAKRAAPVAKKVERSRRRETNKPKHPKPKKPSAAKSKGKKAKRPR